MAHLLYSAENEQGETDSGYVEAASAQEAVAKLTARGLKNIQLHQEPMIAAVGFDPSGLNEEQATRMARFQVGIRKTPGLATVLKEVARQNRFWIAVDVGLLAWGLLTNQAMLTFLGAFFLASTFGVPAWNFRHARRYDRLIRAMAVGDWEQAERLIVLLRNAKLAGAKLPAGIFFDLDVRHAQLLARDGNLTEALSSLDKWRNAFPASPSMFDARVASVYHAAGDVQRFLESMRKAYEQSDGDAARRVDLALAEARLGDPEQAQALVDGVDRAVLPVAGIPFIHWTRGMIALRRDDPSAAHHLAQGVALFLENSAAPAVWTSLALCSAAHAVALHRGGKTGEAQRILHRVAPILAAHGDQQLLAMVDAIPQAPPKV